MKIKLAKIILWPKDAKKKPRIINFTMSGVEVVTGKSQTGKSSLISIVDYCLGSGKCAIPVGVIRETVEWFGVLLKSPKSEILIARKNPGMQAETSAMYFVKGEEVSIPNSLEGLPSISKEAVLSQLNQLAGLPTLSLSGEDEGGFSGRPSFRDTAAFQFQPQHIVANPHTLFFKADTFEHQEKLKQVFPLVLGAIDNETLELRRGLKVLEAELNQKRGLLEEREKRGAAWLQDFKAFYSQSREYGLLPEALDPQEGWTTETYVSYLLPVPSRLENNSFPAIERGASSRLAREIAALREDEDSTAEKIEDRKRKLSRIERLRTSSDGYSKALVVQGNRLQPISWFAQHVNDGHECPVCGSTDKRQSFFPTTTIIIPGLPGQRLLR